MIDMYILRFNFLSSFTGFKCIQFIKKKKKRLKISSKDQVYEKTFQLLSIHQDTVELFNKC